MTSSSLALNCLKFLYGELRTHPYVFAHAVEVLSMEKLSLKDYFKHIKDIIYTSAFPSPTGKHLREERGPRVSNLPQKRAFWASRGTQGQKPWRREFGSLRGAQSWTGRHSERADTLKLLKYTHTNSDIFTDTNYQNSIKHTNPTPQRGAAAILYLAPKRLCRI